MEGWISLYRKITENWIWKSKEPFDKRSAWISLLLRANHEDTKVVIGNQIVKLNKGSFVTSEIKLAKEWKWGRKKVRDFLNVLVNDKMLTKNCTSKYTTLTIENWALYQIEEQQKNNKGTSKEHQRNTDNNDNNINNKKENIKEKRYGEYKNVFFTDEQYKKILNEFPNDYEMRIQRLDDYIQSTGKKYKDCLATIRNWAKKEGYIKPQKQEKVEYIENTMTVEEYFTKLKEEKNV